jgi:hypothetical protein
MTRESIQKLLRSKEVDLPGWAESAEHLAGVERLLGVLAEPTEAMIEASPRGFPSECKLIYREMFAARFGDGG